MEYDGVPYYYRKNALGDIVEIYNASNTLVGSYKYDAWGNCTIGTNVGGIARYNPFRYRGYYFDTETGYYYLQTRYYDPEIGRFINADNIAYLDPLNVNGCNLYIYCSNNPINKIDPTGCSEWFVWLFCGIIAVGLLVGGIFTTGAISAVLLGAGIGASTNYITSLKQGEINLGSFAFDTIVGAIGGLIGYGVGQLFSSMAQGYAIAQNTSDIVGKILNKRMGINFTYKLITKCAEIVGSFVGGMMFNSVLHNAQGKSTTNEENFVESLEGEIPGWLLDFFQFLLKTGRVADLLG